ncbi:MAG: GAF domain-containing protein [Proteobacteria bacterium]|nr:GAF domain-containing protein [Pseudomonadota bacterium]
MARTAPVKNLPSQANPVAEHIRSASSIPGTREKELDAILEISNTINSTLDLDQILLTACKAAVKLLGVSHSGLVLFDDQQKMGEVKADYPDMDIRGIRFPLRGIPTEEQLISTRKPIKINDVEKHSSLGGVRDLLLEHNICSILIVPIVSKRRVLGSFSVDSIGQKRKFTKIEIAACTLLAAQIAPAIENAQLFLQIKRRARALEQLNQTSLEIARFQKFDTLIETVLDRAVDLVGASGGGLYLIDPQGQQFKLTVINKLPPHFLNHEFSTTMGLIAEVLESGRTVSISDYCHWEKRLRIFDSLQFTAVAAAPIFYGDLIWGVVAVHDSTASRVFHIEDTAILTHFANMASIALENVQKRAEIEQLLSGSPDAVITVDNDGRITEFNKRAEEILNYRRDEILGSSEHGIYKSPERAQEIKQLLSDKTAGEVRDIDTYFCNKNGDPIRVYLSASLLSDFQGRTSGSVLFFRAYEKFTIAYQDSYRRLTKLVEVSDRFVGNQGLEKTLEVIRESAFHLLSIDHFALLRCRRANNKILHCEGFPASEFSTRCATAIPLIEDLHGTIKTTSTPRPIFADSSLKASWIKSIFAGKDNIASCAVCPLPGTHEDDYLIVCGYSQRQDFSTEDEVIITLFCKQAGAAIADTQLYEEKSYGLNESVTLKSVAISLTEAVSLTETLDREKVLERVMRVAQELTGADEATLLPYDPVSERFFNQALSISAHDAELTTYRSEVRQRGGVAHQIVTTSLPVFISDTLKDERVSKIARNKGRRAAAGVPLRSRQRTIGVLYVNWRRPYYFTNHDKSLITALATLAASALSNAQIYNDLQQRVEELQKLADAAEAVRSMSTTPDLGLLRQLIVRSSAAVLDADSATLWCYDSLRERFVPSKPLFRDLGDTARQEHSEVEVQLTQDLPLRIIGEKRWVTFSMDNADRDLLGNAMQLEYLKTIAMCAFQASPLTIGNEGIGVLFINYAQSRTFNDTDRRRFEDFAGYASLFLKKANLAQQVNTAKFLSEIASHITAAGATDGTLLAVTNGTRAALGCDSVTLHVYDTQSGNFESFYSPPMGDSGSAHFRGAAQISTVQSDSILYKALQRREPHISGNTSKDAWLRNSDFLEFLGHADVEACVVQPLWAGNIAVGVLFVNFCRAHHFTHEDLVNIGHLANQAAVAISNSQLFNELHRRSEALKCLYETGQAITSKRLGLDETLEEIAIQAQKIITIGSGEQCISYVALLRKEEFEVVAANSDEVLRVLRPAIRQLDLSGLSGKRGIVGRAIRDHIPQRVGDVRKDPDFVALYKNMLSQLAVPLQIEEETLGVLGIEHSRIDAFTVDDERYVGMLAAQAAIGIRNARRYKDLCTILEELTQPKNLSTIS